MASTTHSEFNANTEGVEVAKAFADGVRGKTILITGVNKNGLGFSAAESFASQSPAHMIITGRSTTKPQEAIDALKEKYPNTDYRALVLNLSSQKDVRASAQELLSWSDIPTIDIVINSAGIMLLPERTINEDGIEMHFATNHIGHFLFTCLIMPKLIAAAEGKPKGATRVVNISAGSAEMARPRWSDTNFEKKSKDLPENERPNYQMHQGWGTPDPENAAYIPLEGYNQSKIANVLFAIGLNQRLYEKHGIYATAVHPGVIHTELARNATKETMDAVGAMLEAGVFTTKSFGAGSSTALVAALDPKLVYPGGTVDGKENHGAYLSDCQISGGGQPEAVSSEAAEKLWVKSEGLVRQEFAW